MQDEVSCEINLYFGTKSFPDNRKPEPVLWVPVVAGLRFELRTSGL